jgi:hypothetical protein
MLLGCAARPRGGQEPHLRSVRDYGAVPDDDRDDTAAIQKALRDNRGNYFNGRPDGRTDTGGGVVFLPKGKYLTTGLELFTGNTLRGEPGTLLLCTTDKPAITLKSHFEHDGVAFVAVEDLSITAPKSCAIRSGGVTNAIFHNLRVSSREVCLQFDGYTQAADFDNIYVGQTGSGAVRVSGNANRIRGIDTEGGASPNYPDYKPAKAVVEVNGDGNEISGCILEGGHRGVAFAISGELTQYRNNWIEMDTSGGPTVLLENSAASHFDLLTGVVRMRNCRGVQIAELWTGADHLRESLELDAATGGVVIDVVNAQCDAGGLDDPQVLVRAQYSRIGKIVVERNPFRTRENWCVPLNNKTSPSILAQWKDGTAIAAMVEPKPDRTGNCIRIEIPENAKDGMFYVIVPLKVPALNVGSRPYAMWRADGPAGQNMIVVQGQWAHELPTRSMNSLTATRFVAPVANRDQLIFCFYHAKPGTYRLSDIRVGL